MAQGSPVEETLRSDKPRIVRLWRGGKYSRLDVRYGGEEGYSASEIPVLPRPDNVGAYCDAYEISCFQEFMIRSIDIAGAISGLVLLFPILAMTSFLIKVTSRGSIIYRQRRVGKKGKIFILYKFRTMVSNAEQKWGLLPASEGDERVTFIGKLLRKTHIDELPQLFNVLNGDMSLVGPRPENIYRVNLHTALQGIRLAVKPGITGLAQIRGLYDLKPDHKLKYDYLYIQSRSFRLNIYIILKTIPVLFRKSGW